MRRSTWIYLSKLKYVILAFFLASHVAAPGAAAHEIAEKQIELYALYTQQAYALALPKALELLEEIRKVGGDKTELFAGTLNALAQIYENLAQYEKAERSYKHSRDVLVLLKTEKSKENAVILSNLAFLYVKIGRLEDAEISFKAANAIRSELLDDDLEDLATSTNGLGALYVLLGRLAEAEPLLHSALQMRVRRFRGWMHEDVAISLKDISQLYIAQARYVEAEDALRRSVSILRQVLDPGDLTLSLSLDSLGQLNMLLGRYDEAEKNYIESHDIVRARRSPDHPDMATSFNNLAHLYQSQGRYGEAEEHFRRSLDISEKIDPDNAETAVALHNLGVHYMLSGRLAEAEGHQRRALDIRQRKRPAGHSDIAVSFNSLGALLHQQGRLSEAENFLKRAIDLRSSKVHPDTIASVNNLAAVYQAQKNFTKARDIYESSRSALVQSYGGNHPLTAAATSNIGGAFLAEGRPDEALPHLRRAYEIRLSIFGGGHPETATSLNNLGWLHFAKQDWVTSHSYFSQAHDIYLERGRRVGAALRSPELEAHRAEILDNQHTVIGRIRSAAHLAEADPNRAAALLAQTYENAQTIQKSEAAAALSQMAARFASGDDQLASLIRRRQDLAQRYAEIDKQIVAAQSLAATARDFKSERTWRDQIAEIDRKISILDRDIREGHRDYFDFFRSPPISVNETRRHLGSNEALVQFIVSERESFAWVVAPETGQERWVRIPLGEQAIADKVQALRCGLDESLWTVKDEDARRCRTLLALGDNFKPMNASPPLRAPPPPFFLGKARELYQDLFGQFDDLIRGRTLFIVPSGALGVLPFGALVTSGAEEIPDGDDPYRSSRWLGSRHPFAILPTATSLLHLRRSEVRRAPEPFLGFGNPDLLGKPGGRCGPVKSSFVHPRDCPKLMDGSIVTESEPAPLRSRSGARSDAPQNAADRVGPLVKKGLADPVKLRGECPLPESEFELRCVASTLQTPQTSVRTLEKATETEVKSEALDRYRIIHFATHGLLAVETKEIARDLWEPALVLTPPDGEATALDDGLLTASEIATLHLRADWVALSACNTAAGGEDLDGEAFSGLSRAFLYAGAQALLVSHWKVDSEATVYLMARTVSALGFGRAEALMRSVKTMVGDGSTNFAHPSYWAAFVVVGEGGR